MSQSLPAYRRDASRYREEHAVRCDLAAAYQLAEHFGWSDVIWNHITARVPGAEHFLIKQHQQRYDEVTASSLVKLALDGRVIEGPEDINVTGFVIHSGLYRARPEVNCVLHTHTRAGLAVSCLKDGLIALCNDAMMFVDNVSYHDFEGLSDDVDECERLAASLGRRDALILRNHGLLTVGRTPAEAVMLMYYLDRACRVVLDVLQTGQPYLVVPPAVQAKSAEQYRQYWPGDSEWPALLRLVEKIAPHFRD